MTCSKTKATTAQFIATITKYIELFKNQSLFLSFCKIYVKFLLLRLKITKKSVYELNLEV
jgi:hypothetical protein